MAHDFAMVVKPHVVHWELCTHRRGCLWDILWGLIAASKAKGCCFTLKKQVETLFCAQVLTFGLQRETFSYFVRN